MPENKFSREDLALFWGKASPFSNWHPSQFTCNDVTYDCGEQYMMHRKALTFGDKSVALRVLAAYDPASQKALGREVQNFDKNIWQAVNMSLMFEGLFAKFSQNQQLAQVLLKTESRVLVEASPVDRIWGVGLAATDSRILDKAQWRGENRLGIVLMRVRDALRAAQCSTQDRQASLFQQ